MLDLGFSVKNFRSGRDGSREGVQVEERQGHGGFWCFVEKRRNV